MARVQTSEVQLGELLRLVAREKEIDEGKWVAALEDAMASAAKKQHRIKEPVKSIFNLETGHFDAFIVKQVVEEVEDPLAEWTLEEARDHKADAEIGEEIHIPISTEGLGRIAAQSAKQVLYQRIREAEREKVYDEYIDRVGEVVNGTVRRFERGDIIVDLGRTEAIVPRSEQARHERYSQGDRIRAVIVEVHKQPKGPQVVLSRTDPRLLMKLFEMEVPEIYDGTVVIKNAVRAPGERAKVAVDQPRARRRPGRRLRRHEGLPRAGDHPRAARREDRHHRVQRGPGHLRPECVGTGQDHSRVDQARGGGAAPRRHRRGRPAVARHRQARPERAARRRADRLQDRHQERERGQGRGRRRPRCPAARRRGAGRGGGHRGGARSHHGAGHRRGDRRGIAGCRLRHPRGARRGRSAKRWLPSRVSTARPPRA